MGRFLSLVFLFSTYAIAAQDITLEQTLAALNQRLTASNTPASELFNPDIPASERDGFLNLYRTLLDEARRPWSEVSAPAIVSRSIRFITSDVAMVDAALTQTGVAPRSIPILFVMKREDASWKIASVRPHCTWPSARVILPQDR